MSLQNEENELWKKDLISLLSESLSDIVNSKKNAEKVGYYYSCYAPAFLYKYYSDNTLNIEAIKNNKMWYSSPLRFNDVFDCDLLINQDKIKDSLKKLFPDSRGFRVGSPAWREFQAISKKALNVNFPA